MNHRTDIHEDIVAFPLQNDIVQLYLSFIILDDYRSQKIRAGAQNKHSKYHGNGSWITTARYGRAMTCSERIYEASFQNNSKKPDLSRA